MRVQSVYSTLRDGMHGVRIALPARRGVIVQARAGATKNREPRPQNAPGQFFVDHTCIDCDTCRWMAPSTFSRVEGQSAVTSQPETQDDTVEAVKALLSCPTYSIHATSLPSETLKAAQQGLPAPVPGCPGVYHCGWHSEKSFAAASYLIVRPGGNVLVDSPRFNPVLARRVQELGGAAYLFLTHKDDVADHDKWAKHLGCQRLLHSLEVRPGTEGVEVKLQGEGPWRLPDGGDDVELVFTPGHTPAHVCLFHAPSQALFTGDHLSSGDGEAWGEAASQASSGGSEPALFADDQFNWYSFPKQLESVAALKAVPFRHVLPGHGRRRQFASVEEAHAAIDRLLQWHKVQAS